MLYDGNAISVKGNRPLADFLPTLTIAAKNLATEMTNYNVEEKDLWGEVPITSEHVQNNIIPFYVPEGIADAFFPTC